MPTPISFTSFSWKTKKPLSKRIMAVVHFQGLEPWARWLRVSCSTNWARSAYVLNSKSCKTIQPSRSFSEPLLCCLKIKKAKRKAGAYLFSQAVSSQVSSAQQSLTSVFGMGTGGTSASSAPAICSAYRLTYSLLRGMHPQNWIINCGQIRSTIKTCGQALDLLVHASSTCHHAYTLCLSTL